MRVLAVLLIAPAIGLAQRWQVGGAIGQGFYREASVFAPAGRAAAGIRDRFAASFFVTEQVSPRIAGEIRYAYQDGDPFLEAAGVQTNIQGQSHAFHYDVLIDLRRSGARLSPFIAAGAGVKLYVVSGPPPIAQPLGAIAQLTPTDETKAMVSLGGGIRYALSRRVVLRVDFRDYITTFPRRLILPAPFGTARGIFHQLTPLVGVAWAF